MSTVSLDQHDLQTDSVDLRRSLSRTLVQTLSERSVFLPNTDHALIKEVYVSGKSIADVARSRGVEISPLRRRVRRLTSRMLTPRYRFVTEHRHTWRPTRKKVADACVIQGLSIKEAADRLDMSVYLVRKHRDAIEAMVEALGTQTNSGDE